MHRMRQDMAAAADTGVRRIVASARGSGQGLGSAFPNSISHAILFPAEKPRDHVFHLPSPILQGDQAVSEDPVAHPSVATQDTSRRQWPCADLINVALCHRCHAEVGQWPASWAGQLPTAWEREQKGKSPSRSFAMQPPRKCRWP